MKYSTRRSYRKEDKGCRSNSSRTPAETAAHREAISARGIGLLQDGTHAMSQGLLSPPRQTPSISKDGKAAVGWSRLVASAHGPLKRILALLEQREVDARRAKDDAKNMMSSYGSETPASW